MWMLPTQKSSDIRKISFLCAKKLQRTQKQNFKERKGWFNKPLKFDFV